MKITKYEHACVVLEINEAKLVIDPSDLASSLPQNLLGIEAIVVTHQHADHFSEDVINRILQLNPDAVVYAPSDTVDLVKSSNKLQAAKQGMQVQTNSFIIEFFGDEHAIIYGVSPCQNVGILVNNLFYYAGDSFTLPNKKVTVLAAPASAPWMKSSEAMEFIKNVSPQYVFATHTGLLSAFGKQVTYNWLSRAANEAGATWQDIDTGDSFTVTD